MNLTVLGQPSSQDSVTISRDAQKECIKYYKKTLRQDSTITDNNKIIDNLNVFIDSIADVAVDGLDLQLQNCKSDLETMTSKRDKWKKVGIITGIVAALEGVYIWLRETVFK